MHPKLNNKCCTASSTVVKVGSIPKHDMARAQVATLVLLMLATSMLANTATAATATPLKGRKLLIVTGSSIQANPLRRKLLGDESCYAVEPNHRCDSESQFYCCEYHDYSSKEWVGCSIHNNNKYCPQDSPLSVCCELDK